MKKPSIPVIIVASVVVPAMIPFGSQGQQTPAPATAAWVAAANLLRSNSLRTTQFPPIETGILNGDLVFRQHSAGHTPNPNWPYFLAFAEREFK